MKLKVSAEMLKVNSWRSSAGSRRLPTAAARVRVRVRTCGICGGHIGDGPGFLQVPRFPLPSFLQIALHSTSLIIIRGWYSQASSGTSNSELGSTPPQKGRKHKSIHVTFTTRWEACPPVHINSVQLPQEDDVKYLGLHLDRRLTWHKKTFSQNGNN
jgi:hypothetical protein